MRHTFTAEQWLPHPVETVFAFFADPRNLPRLMPSWQKARIEEAVLVPPPAGPASMRGAPVAGPGSRITLSFRPFPLSPVRIPWEAEISEFAWNSHFCDSQLRGPFAFWRHCHRILPETRNGPLGAAVAGSLLRDQVEYQMHLGLLGDLMGRLFAEAQLRRTFAFRHRRTAELFAPLSSPKPV